MKVIVGLGNPHKRYEKTRHNVGFMVIDKIAKKKKVKWERSVMPEAWIGQIPEEPVLIVKLLVFMNNSGYGVKDLVEKYKLKLENLLVVYDDVDLELGRMKFKTKGGAAGHRGFASVIDCLGTEEINRLRIGIGRPSDGNLVEFVLSEFSSEEKEVIEKVLERAMYCCLDWTKFSAEYIMNKYNN